MKDFLNPLLKKQDSSCETHKIFLFPQERPPSFFVVITYVLALLLRRFNKLPECSLNKDEI